MFGGFTFAAGVLLGRIAAFYGFPIPETERATSLAEVMRARLPRKPTLGDRIRIADVELVVREMTGGQIATISLELEPRASS